MSDLVCQESAKSNKSSKSEILNRGRSIPYSKYFCLPSSTLENLFTLRGLCPRLNKPFIFKDVEKQFSIDWKVYAKRNEARRIAIKHIKLDWLKESDNEKFWNNVLFGVNRVLRRLETNRHNNYYSECFYVFFDSRWLSTPLGHHLVNLCEVKSVKLVVIKPFGLFPDLVSTVFRPIVKLIAFGILRTNDIPNDLKEFLDYLDKNVLSLVNSSNECDEEMKTNFKATDFVEPQKYSWESIAIDSNIYDYDTSTHRSYTLHEYLSTSWSSTANAMSSADSITQLVDVDDDDEIHEFGGATAYSTPQFRSVDRSNDEDRRSRKRKKHQVLSQLSTRKKTWKKLKKKL